MRQSWPRSSTAAWEAGTRPAEPPGSRASRPGGLPARADRSLRELASRAGRRSCPRPSARPSRGLSRAPNPADAPKNRQHRNSPRRLHGNGYPLRSPAPVDGAPHNKTRSHWLRRLSVDQSACSSARRARPSGRLAQGAPRSASGNQLHRGLVPDLCWRNRLAVGLPAPSSALFAAVCPGTGGMGAVRSMHHFFPKRITTSKAQVSNY